jgi:hypothetical protein
VSSPVADLLADLHAALRRIGARWYLFGAQAAILYGAARLTADVDVTIDPGALPTSTIMDELQRAGFVLRVADAERFVERTRVLPLLHERSGIPCDVVLAGPGIEDLFFERTCVRVVEGLEVPVVAADDLVAMKILAGRPKDLDDVAAIVRAQGGGLDLVRARETLGLLEQALDRRDLLPLLETTLARTRRTP